MHSRFLTQIVVSASVALGLGSRAWAEPDPAGQKIEAETVVASDSKVVEDAASSGGKAVVNTRAWQPVVQADVPTTGGETFTIFARHQGGPIQLKTSSGGSQTERAWVWASPAVWTWSSFGTYSRADLGDHVILMRGEHDGPISIDAIVFSPGKVDAPEPPKPTLPPASLDASLPATSADVRVDWTQTLAPVPAAIWGVNDYEILNPQTAADPAFNAFLAKLNPPLIRIHQGGLPSAWMNEAQTEWDVEKIKAGFAGVKQGYGQAKLMLNLAGWPKPMTAPDETLDLSKIDDYATLYVDLLKIIREQVGVKIDYWEITNERDDRYEKLNKLPELWQIFNTVSSAIKKADPAAKVGGPAFTWPKPVWVNGFVENCLDHADFVTYHNYGVGEIYDSNEKLYSALDTLEGHARFIRQTVDRAAPDRHVPIFLDEYNVKWTWEPIEPRHANSVGAVFQAGVVRRALLAGIDAASVWHVKGNAYGILDGDNKPRPTATLFLWGPQHLVGERVSLVNKDKSLEIIAVRRKDGGRAVLIANKANHAVRLNDATPLLGEPKTYVGRVDADGSRVLQPTDDLALLPGYSLTLFSTSAVSVP